MAEDLDYLLSANIPCIKVVKRKYSVCYVQKHLSEKSKEW